MMRRLLCCAAVALTAACGGEGTGPAVPAVATVVVQPDSVMLAPGASLQLSATLRDAQGSVLTGRSVTWSSSDRARADVSAAGLVTAAASGRVVITATSGDRSGDAVVHVGTGTADFAVVGAQFTQGVQAADGSIPMVLGGGAAVVNVLLSASPPQSASMQVVLRLWDAATQTLVRADTALTQRPLGGTPTYLDPSVQFLLPAAALRAGLEWQVVRDPRGVMSDDSAANDVFPRTGRLPLATVDVPLFRLRFVPIVLAAHGGATGAISEATLPDYLRTVQSVLPLGPADVRIGTPLTTNASFGAPPSGGQQAFWVQVLDELDLARLADPDHADAHWYGVVRPPPGFNFTQFGGFGYIPAFGSSTGARTRTALSVQVGWFTNPTQARDLIAHELGHNFGRRHAPCGNAGSPLDTSYPNASGVLDLAGHDVYAWSRLGTVRAGTVPASTGDVMGYCFPVWASSYTYRGILQFRAPLAQAPAVTRVLVVRGSVDGGAVRLAPAFTFDARPSLPERSGDWVLEGFTVGGRILFSHAFEPARLDHAPDTRPFTLALPVTAEIEGTLHALRVRGPTGQAQLTAGDAVLHAPPPGAPVEAVVVRAAAEGTVRVECPAHATRGVLVQHGGSGALLGSDHAASLTVLAAPGVPLTISCSDGIRTVRHDSRAP